MPIEHLYIARVTDGLILVRKMILIYVLQISLNYLMSAQVASMEHGPNSNNEKMELFKNQVIIA
jgi:hypothetical protein